MYQNIDKAKADRLIKCKIAKKKIVWYIFLKKVNDFVMNNIEQISLVTALLLKSFINRVRSNLAEYSK